MAKQWYVRTYGLNFDNKYVVDFADVPSPFNGSNQNILTRQLEKVLNRELPEGQLRKRRAKVVA
jgi:hypothetical protein